jgi:ssDNA-binding Zn-finger/Zn-ribbon topoisomerase 1
MEKTADIIETAEMEATAFAPEEIMVTDEMMPMDLVIVDEPRAEAPKEPGDYDKTQDVGDFMSWITKKMTSLPPHSGKTTAGCERVIAHLKMLDKEISKAISSDVDCVLDDQAVEKFRKDIRKMVKKLQKRHSEINEAYDADDDKFAADESAALVKEADGEQASWQCPKCHKEVKPGDEEHKERHKAMCVAAADDAELNKAAHACACQVEKVADDTCPTCKIKLWKAAEGLYECISCDATFERPLTKEAGTAKLTLIMTPFERAITGAIVNGFVSQGKNPEEIYAELKKKYKFSDRDELSIQQVLADMGYPFLKDRGHLGDESEQLNKGKGIEFSTQYNA